MRLHTRLQWFVAFAVLGYAASPAGAQPAQGGRAGAGGGLDTQVGFQRPVTLSPEQQVAQVQAALDYASKAREAVARQLGKARQQRDVVKMLCLNDKLNQLDVANRTLQERQHAHAAAVQRNDTELMNHEFTIVSVLRQRIEQLMTEANQCIGEEAAFTGATTTFTTVDPNLPPSDETEYPPSGPVEIPPPPTNVPPPQPVSPAL